MTTVITPEHLPGTLDYLSSSSRWRAVYERLCNPSSCGFKLVFGEDVGIEAVDGEGTMELAFPDLVDLDEEALTPEDAQCFLNGLKRRDSETIMSMTHPEEIIHTPPPSTASSISSLPSSPQDSFMFASANEDLIKGAFSVLELGKKTVMVLDKKNVLNFGKRTVLAVTKATSPILAKWNIQNVGRKNVLCLGTKTVLALDKRAISNIGKSTVLNLDQQTDFNAMHSVKGNVDFEGNEEDEAANGVNSKLAPVRSWSKRESDDLYDVNISDQDSERDGTGELSKKARLGY